MARRVLDFLSSLRLTVTLLVLGIVLVFLGTLAQEPMGLYLVQERFFKSFFVDAVAMNAAVRKTAHLFALQVAPLPPEAYFARPLIPVFPGGYLVGGLLLANLVAAHVRRFKFAWGKSGIVLTHVGLILLLLGQLFTDLMSRESQMSFREGETRNYSEDFAKHELALVTDVEGGERERVVAVPSTLLKEGGEFRHERVPFTLKVRQLAQNANVRRRAPMVDTNLPPASSQGAGAGFVLLPLPPSLSMDRRDQPAAVVEVEAGGGSLGTWLVAPALLPQRLPGAAAGWRIELRPTRYYQPFALTLLRTKHEIYRGTTTPKNFESRVELDHPAQGEKRVVDIYMNQPLRHGGLTFYQFQMGREQLEAGGRGTSALQVVRNPSWLGPYFGTVLVFGGLMVQFLIHLVAFVGRRSRPSKPASPSPTPSPRPGPSSTSKPAVA